jgi:hypothetical protein
MKLQVLLMEQGRIVEFDKSGLVSLKTIAVD